MLGACTEVYLRVFYLVKIFSHSRLNPRWYPLFPSVPATVPTNDDPSKQTRSRDSRPFGNQCKSTKHKTQHKGWPWEIISLNKLPTPPLQPKQPAASGHISLSLVSIRLPLTVPSDTCGESLPSSRHPPKMTRGEVVGIVRLTCVVS